MLAHSRKERTHPDSSRTFSTVSDVIMASSPTVSRDSGDGSVKDEELRMVMVGKTGTGKSAAGNTILGRECFRSKFSAVSLTQDCSQGGGSVDGLKVAVIDTPGLFGTRFGEETETQRAACVTLAAPGPHVFLVVIRLGRFTEEDGKTVQRIQEIFGPAADRYSMVLFTHGDRLDGTPIEDFLDESPDLQELVSRCNGRYHVFNNKSKDRSQVTLLLQKIQDIIQRNGGSHYTNQMFQEAETALEEEKRHILKEKEEQTAREREELERKAKAQFEEQMKKKREELQAERERERKEREEERRKEREEMDEEREKGEAELKREREEREEELRRMKEQYESELEAQMTDPNRFSLW